MTELSEGADILRGRKGSTTSEIFLGNETGSLVHGPNLTPRPFATPDSRRDFDAPIDNDFGDMDINLPIDFPMLDIDPPLELPETANGEAELSLQVQDPPAHEDHEVELVVNGHEQGMYRLLLRIL